MDPYDDISRECYISSSQEEIFEALLSASDTDSVDDDDLGIFSSSWSSSSSSFFSSDGVANSGHSPSPGAGITICSLPQTPPPPPPPPPLPQQQTSDTAKDSTFQVWDNISKKCTSSLHSSPNSGALDMDHDDMNSVGSDCFTQFGVSDSQAADAHTNQAFDSGAAADTDTAPPCDAMDTDVNLVSVDLVFKRLAYGVSQGGGGVSKVGFLEPKETENQLLDVIVTEGQSDNVGRLGKLPSLIGASGPKEDAAEDSSGECTEMLEDLIVQKASEAMNARSAESKVGFLVAKEPEYQQFNLQVVEGQSESVGHFQGMPSLIGSRPKEQAEIRSRECYTVLENSILEKLPGVGDDAQSTGSKVEFLESKESEYQRIGAQVTEGQSDNVGRWRQLPSPIRSRPGEQEENSPGECEELPTNLILERLSEVMSVLSTDPKYNSNDDAGYVDILQEGKQAGYTFPMPRWWPADRKF